MPHQQAVKRRAQAVDVGRRADAVDFAVGLLGTHVLRRADRGPGTGERRVAGPSIRKSTRVRAFLVFIAPEQLGQSPVDDQRLAERPEHDVIGLQVAVHDAAAMCISDRVAGVDHALEQAAECQLALAGLAWRAVAGVEPDDRLLECLAFDQAHRVVRPPVGILTEPVDRHDSRVLEPPGDPGFQQEARLAGRIERMVRLELLERDLPIQLGIERQKHLAQAPAGHRTDDAVSVARAGRTVGKVALLSRTFWADVSDCRERIGENVRG